MGTENGKQSERPNEAGKRCHLLDALRGLTIIGMIAYHALWDVVFILDISVPWYFSDEAYYWQQSICYTFILLSGFCISLGKRRLKRGVQVLACGIVVSVVTILFLPSERILFGVLFMLGASMLIVATGYSFFTKVQPVLGLVLSGVLFLLTKPINRGSLGLGDIRLWKLPKELYDKGYFMTFLGFEDKDFYSTDYFSMMPWFFLFLVGFYLYRTLLWAEQKKRTGDDSESTSGNIPRILQKDYRRIPVLSFLGRHSLLIYMLHQPVLYGIAMVIKMLS